MSYIICRMTDAVSRQIRLLDEVTNETPASSAVTANLRTNIMDFRGFDSSIIVLSLRGGIIMSIGDSPKSLSQAILVVIVLFGGLGVRLCF